jgi:hypothetical protein
LPGIQSSVIVQASDGVACCRLTRHSSGRLRRRLIPALGSMGSSDTVQLLGTEAEPPILIVRQHRLSTTVRVPVDRKTYSSFAKVLSATDGETYWLRSLRGALRWWQLGGDYDVLVRAKSGHSRREAFVPCSRAAFRALQRVLQAEWSAA